MTMFNTQLLILEVQKRPCLWDLQEKSHSDRGVKQKAWEEVAEILFKDWFGLTSAEKNEKLKLIKNKWKNARDYYVREKNKETDEAKGRAAKRKWNCPYFDSLQFLKINKTENKKDSFSRVDLPETAEENTYEDSEFRSFIENNAEEEIEVKYEPAAPEISIFEPSTSNESSVIPSMNNPLSTFNESYLRRMNKNDDDPNLHFLLSILPEMSKMTERQNFEFRMEVMKALNKVKYKLPDLTNPDSR